MFGKVIWVYRGYEWYIWQVTTRHIKFSLYKHVKPTYRVVTIPKGENCIK